MARNGSYRAARPPTTRKSPTCSTAAAPGAFPTASASLSRLTRRTKSSGTKTACISTPAWRSTCRPRRRTLRSALRSCTRRVRVWRRRIIASSGVPTRRDRGRRSSRCGGVDGLRGRFDGHNGAFCADYCKTHLLEVFLESYAEGLRGTWGFERVVRRRSLLQAMIARLEARLEALLAAAPLESVSGCTCLLCYLQDCDLFVANLGDTQSKRDRGLIVEAISPDRENCCPSAKSTARSSTASASKPPAAG